MGRPQILSIDSPTLGYNLSQVPSSGVRHGHRPPFRDRHDACRC